MGEGFCDGNGRSERKGREFFFFGIDMYRLYDG